jgi:hypothetical protein
VGRMGRGGVVLYAFVEDYFGDGRHFKVGSHGRCVCGAASCVGILWFASR